MKGCTACVVLMKNQTLYVANAGDSRTVLAKKGKAVELTVDHKPELESELKRITKAGGSVVDGRVDGNLNLSRAFGDRARGGDAPRSTGSTRIASATGDFTRLIGHIHK